VVGCKECHSHNEGGVLQEFTGGDPKDAFVGVFRLGPDLPLRTSEKGLSAFPYPGYAVLYGGNLTKYGVDGPSKNTSVFDLVRAMRGGIAVEPDQYGRPRPLEHIMLWQFYSQMSDGDAYSIASLVKRLRYVPHDVPQGPIRFGEDWRAAFKQVFGQDPSPHDATIFGK
jgi:hypothetical protein